MGNRFQWKNQQGNGEFLAALLGFGVVQWHASSSTTNRPLEKEEDYSSPTVDKLTLGLLPLLRQL